MNKTILTCAVTGAGPYNDRSRYVPVSPTAIADECLSAARAGAAVCHIHVREPSGVPSMEIKYYREVVERIRASDTDVIINLTTGAGARYIPSEDDPLKADAGSTLTFPNTRVRHVIELQPEICSLDIGTMNFGSHAVLNTPKHVTDMATAVQSVGTKPELEVFDIGHIDQACRMINDGIILGKPFFQICLGVAGGAPATPQTLMTLLNYLPQQVHWGAFGISASSLPIVAQCVLLGGHVRVGLEDNIYMQRGELAKGNAVLVEQAAKIVRMLGSDLATPAEARMLLELKEYKGAVGALRN